MKNVPAAGPRYNNIIYNNNGTGRDSYIYGNNGGNTILSLPAMQLKPSSIKLGGAKTAVNCMIEGRPSRYVTNGSGRDGYIYHNDGGFSSPTEVTRKLGTGNQFENGLRNYRPSEKRFQKKKMSP